MSDCRECKNLSQYADKPYCAATFNSTNRFFAKRSHMVVDELECCYFESYDFMFLLVLAKAEEDDTTWLIVENVSI